MNVNKGESLGIYGFEWLYTQIHDPKTKEAVDKIIAIEQSYMDGHPIAVGNDLMKLHLGENIVWTRENTTHSIPFGYFQIFKLLNEIIPAAFKAPMSGLIIDVGANEGHWSLYISKHHPHASILAIEPNPRALELLRKNLASNHQTNVEILPIAISSRPEIRKLETIDNLTALGSFRIDRSGRPWLTPDRIRKIPVQCEALDNLPQVQQAKNIGLLKIDVEGAELEVIHGAAETLKKTKRVEIEYASNQNRAMLIRIFADCGFSLLLDHPYPDDYPNQRGDLFLLKE